jgi:D-alanyl-D-alanine carboxypeptidase
LNGDIYIIGGGDALLSVSDIEQIADGIKDLGINKINGNIYGDGSLFDKITNRFEYSGDKDEVQAVAPITALAIECNVVNVIVTSGAIAGKPVNVQFKPASSAFIYSNTAVVSGAKAPSNNKNSKSKKNKTATPISITTSIDEKEQQVFHIKGSLAPNRTYSYKHFIRNPILTVAGILKDRLISGGVVVTGEIGEKEFPKSAKLQSIDLF